MKKNINEELKNIKYLFNYNRGRVISEQQLFEDEDELPSFDLDGIFKGMSKSNGDMHTAGEDLTRSSLSDIDMHTAGEDLAPSFDSDGNFLGMVKPNRDDMELDEDEDLNYLKNDLEENEIETPVRPGIKTPTKPKKPGTPYSPKPGPKKNPKAKKGDMPDWLSFDEIGINFE